MARDMTRDEWRAFVSAGTRTAHVATTRADGRPHVAPIWFVLDGDDVVFTTHADTVKGRALRRGGPVAISVDDQTPPYSFVFIEGIAEPSTDLDEMRRWATAIGSRYMGSEAGADFGLRNAVEGELLVRVRLTKVVAKADMAA